MQQHVTPQCYMRGFRDPGVDARMGAQVWAVDLKNETIKGKSPKGIAAISDYYKIQLSPDQEPNQIFESELGRIESNAAPLLVRLRDGCCRLSDSERSWLAVFMASLHARTPSSRQNIDTLAQKMVESVFKRKVRASDFSHSFREANRGRDISDARIEQLQRLLIKPRIIPEFSLEQVLTITSTLARMIFEMCWRFTIPPIGKHFITNDNPVVWYDGSAPAPLRHALASRNTILLFPVGPEVALVGSWSDRPDGYDRIDDKVTESINQWIVSSADRWIIAARRDEAASSLCQWRAVKNRGVTLGPLQLETFEADCPQSRGFGIGAFFR